MRTGRLYLKDILDAMTAIDKFVEGIGLEQFRNDDKTSSAVIRKFEIIGEAAKNVPEDTKRKYPSVPWKRMAGMRDRLIHFYFGVKHELVWETIMGELPKLKPLIRQALEEAPGDSG